jgi:hypothetical protein
MVNALRHPDIGTILGIAASEDVTKYLGLQYATLSDRFAPPQLREYAHNTIVNATTNG